MISAEWSARATWAIAALATAGVVARPWRLPEFVWAVAGAVALVALGLLPLSQAGAAVAEGTDVYLFLVGMMLLAEVARREGLFDHVAARAVRAARGSPRRLFALVYLVGTVVTVFLSNDATAVVMTPAVYAAAKAGRAEPLPYLFICAFVANAASFVLPISNPANLVIFRDHMPPLLEWLARFALPSLLAIAATYGTLRLTQRGALRGELAGDAEVPPLSGGGRLAAWGIVIAAAALLTASALDTKLGWPTCVAGALTAVAAQVLRHEAPWRLLGGVSWGVLPLVAGLFVLVQGLERTGVVRELGALLADAARRAPAETAGLSGLAIGFVSNLMNNLPAGLIGGSLVTQGQLPPQVAAGLLIGVDLGPNLSITGSLATILWLVALRREGEEVGFGRFLRLGAIVMPPALLLTLGGMLVAGSL